MSLSVADNLTKTALKAKVNNILCYLEKRDNLIAIKKLGKFTYFVDQVEAEGRLDSYEADYLIHESTIHLKYLI